jgi:predicted O-linked N-acetylglucosamine transferase (SPINDLY family)
VIRSFLRKSLRRTSVERLALLKAKLIQNRLTTPLFNTEMTTDHIERAYLEMYERHRRGLPPDDIEVACLFRFDAR